MAVSQSSRLMIEMIKRIVQGPLSSPLGKGGASNLAREQDVVVRAERERESIEVERKPRPPLV